MSELNAEGRCPTCGRRHATLSEASPLVAAHRAAEQPAQAASIDTPELLTLLDKLVDAAGENVAAFHSARGTLIAYIDARRAPVTSREAAPAAQEGGAS